jgi:hypothetical protein
MNQFQPPQFQQFPPQFPPRHSMKQLAMRGVTINMRTRYALTFYYVVTSLLVVCAAIIVVKLLFFPPCTPAGPNGSVCTVDGWSIAGLAATVLGVAAAILTILGALAVAYWWAELDKRVKAHVTELFNAPLDNKVEDLLDKQKKKVEAQATKISFLNEELDQTRRSAKNTFDLVLSIATADGIEIVLATWGICSKKER